MSELAAEVLEDSRTGHNTRHTLIAQLRQSVYSRLAGYEDTNDAEQLCNDPAMRRVVGGRALGHTAASTSQMGRFETAWLANDKNLVALADLSGHWIDRVHSRHPPKGIVLDMDSSVSPTYGDQEGTAYNGHFACTCYHPLFVFIRYRDKVERRFFRGDAAFALPDLYEFLETEGYKYTIRLKANTIVCGGAKVVHGSGGIVPAAGGVKLCHL